MDLGRGTVLSLLRDLEVGNSFRTISNLHGHTSFSRRMVLNSVLEGHHGCVNRLALSEDASLLLSGSDDCNLIMWSIESGTSVVKRGSVAPGHYANIFGVAFMPGTGNEMVASAGLDTQVRHTHFETAHSTLWTHHTEMVKTVHPVDTHSFVTSSKDGTARLIDVRQTPAVEPPIVANIPGELGQLVPMSSAILSPVNSNHLLIAASDAYMRIFDLRVSPFPRGRSTPSSVNFDPCIEVYSPSHLHPASPEPSLIGHFHNVQSTYANFSSDGRQIVASYFDDAVFVFDRMHQSGHTFCTPPFQSKSRREMAATQFSTQAASYILAQKFEQATTAARRVLELDENDMFAMVCLAISLPKCQQLSDARTAYGYLTKVLRQIEDDHRSVLRLWDRSERTFSKQDLWFLAADMWKIILEFLRVDHLLRLCPPLYQRPSNPDRHGRELIVNRLDSLDRICEKLISQCDQKLVSPEKSEHEFVEMVNYRAIDLLKSHKGPENCRFARMRIDVLRILVQKFSQGILRVRQQIRWLKEPMPRSFIRRGIGFVAVGNVDSRSSDSRSQAEFEYTNPEEFNSRLARSPHFASNQAQASVRRNTEMNDDLKQLWGPLELQDGCRRFHGHVSKETEIKEANFFGSGNQVVLSGSDDGKVYLWSSTTGALLSCIEADVQIVNCVIGHPYHTMIISSGIDDTIKVLTPGRKIIPSLATYPSDQEEED